MNKTIVYGIAQKDFIIDYLRTHPNRYELRTKLKPPIFNYITALNNPEAAQSFRAKLKIFLSVMASRPEFLLSNKWKSIQLEMDTDFNKEEWISLEFESGQEKLVPLISNSLLRLGLKGKILDLVNHEIKRNLNKHKILLSNISFETHERQKFKNESLLRNKFFSAKLSRGPYSTLDSRIYTQLKLSPDYLKLWSYKKLSSASVMHGNVILAEDFFWSYDSAQIEESFKQAVGQLFLGKNWEILTPKPSCNRGSLKEAIFLGGTNNIMHFVIEDLPRILIFQTLFIATEIPIIIRSDLSAQIISLIKILSKREVILISPFDYITVDSLHILHFDNPLIPITSGTESNITKIADEACLRKAREIIEDYFSERKHLSSESKILLLREKNLFRPIVNIEKIKKFLSHMGYSSFYLADKSMQEIFDIFYNAKIVVGAYGAGLANIFLMKNPGIIIELRGPYEKICKEYEGYSTCLNNDHRVVIGKRRLVSKTGFSKGPYKILIRKLRKLLI